MTSTNGGSTSVSLSGTGRQVSVTGSIVISELRFRGPGSANDEFIELYNNRERGRYRWFSAEGIEQQPATSVRATVPAGSTIPAAWTLSLRQRGDQAAPRRHADQTYYWLYRRRRGCHHAGGRRRSRSGGAERWIGVRRRRSPREPGHASGQDRSYERLPGGANGNGVDSGDNAADFALISPSTPQSLTSPITPALTLSPASIDFGSIARGSTAGATFTIANNAAVAVTLASPFTLSGTHATEFSVGLPASTTINALDQTTTLVTFQPNTLGPKAATLSVSSTSGETHLIALTGIASCPTVTVSAALSPFEAGVFASQTVSATGGSGTYSFAIASGALPGGLSLSSSGILSGTPTSIGCLPGHHSSDGSGSGAGRRLQRIDGGDGDRPTDTSRRSVPRRSGSA